MKGAMEQLSDCALEKKSMDSMIQERNKKMEQYSMQKKTLQVHNTYYYDYNKCVNFNAALESDF